MRPEAMRSRYSASAQFFHWVSALLVGVAWLLGQLRDDFERGEPRRIVDFVHVSSGQLIVALLALRIIWRFIDPPSPEASPGRPLGRSRREIRAYPSLCPLDRRAGGGSGHSVRRRQAAAVVRPLGNRFPLGQGQGARTFRQGSARVAGQWADRPRGASRKRGARASLPAARRRAETDAAAMDRGVKQRPGGRRLPENSLSHPLRRREPPRQLAKTLRRDAQQQPHVALRQRLALQHLGVAVGPGEAFAIGAV